MIIGLCGKPHSGKSEVANILVAKHKFQYIDTKDKLRQICSEITGIPYSTFTTSSGKDQLYKGIKLREIMGTVGLSLEKMFGADYLLAEAMKQYKNGNAVVDSLRQKQAVYFRGYLVEVKSTRAIDTHLSYDKFDKEFINYKLENSGDLGDLEDSIKTMLSKIK